MAVLFKRDVRQDPDMPLEKMLEKEGWQVDMGNKSSLYATKDVPQLGEICSSYFPIDDPDHIGWYTELLGIVEEDTVKGYDYAMIFPSDHMMYGVASCMTSMLFSRRNALAKKLQRQYGDDVEVKKSFGYLGVDDIGE